MPTTTSSGTSWPAVHVAGRFAAERRVRLVRVAQHFAGRQMGDAEIVLQPLGLRPFSSTGRTKEHDAHGRGKVECQESGVESQSLTASPATYSLLTYSTYSTAIGYFSSSPV